MNGKLSMALLLVFASAVGAQTGPLSLPEVRRIAWENNWDLLAARSGIDLATAQLLVAKEFPNPTASWNTTKIGSRENATSLGNGLGERSYDSLAAVSQLIEIGGKRRERQAAARAGVLGAKARFADARRTLEQGVTKAYVAALLAGENARIIGESAGYLRHERDIAETRFKAGDIAESDLKQIRIAAEQYELQVTAAEVAARQARVTLEVLLGVARPGGDIQLSDSLDKIRMDIPPEGSSHTNALRADVLAAETDVHAAEANLKLQKALRIPDPTISLGYEHNPPGGGPPADTLNFGVSFPLPLWNQNRGNISAAKASLAQAGFALEKIRAQAAADVAIARSAYQEAVERSRRYADHIRPQSDAVRKSVGYRYEKGGAALVDFLEAERTDNEVQLAAAQAQADAANALADLKAATEVLNSPDFLP